MTYAYASDCTNDGSSTTSVLSQIDGSLSLGLVLGPIIGWPLRPSRPRALELIVSKHIGSVIVRFTGELLTPFYAIILLRALYLVILLLAIPESLSHARRSDHHQSRRSADASSIPTRGPRSLATAAQGRFLRAAWAPVSILFPKSPSSMEVYPLLGESVAARSLGRRNIAWLAVTFALVCVNPVNYRSSDLY